MLGTRDCVRVGVLYSLEAWAAYAAAECLFSSILPLIVPTARSYSLANDMFTVVVTVLYLCAGIAAGVVLGIVARPLTLHRLEPAPLLRALSTLIIAAAFVINFRLYGPDSFAAGIAFLWTALLIASGISAVWSERLSLLVNPWTTAFVLIGPEWLSWELLSEAPPASRLFAQTGYVACVLLLTWLVRLLRIRNALVPATCGIIALLGAAFLLDEPVLVAASIAATPPKDVPNVILITLDTVRADHLSLYGYDRRTTPNLEALARESVVYTNAISTGDMTLSTHGSIFTGLYPSRHGAHPIPTRDLGVPLSRKLPSLPELLQGRGYRTSAIVANYAYLAAEFGFARGFDTYDARAAVPFLAESRPFYLRGRVRNYIARTAAPAECERKTRIGEEINELALSELRRLKGRPFFLFLNYMDAHWPYLPPAPFDRVFPGKLPHFTSHDYFELVDDVLAHKRQITASEQQHIVSQYDGSLAYLDEQLGRLITAMKRLGIFDRSLIIITADHGEAFGERQLMEHGVSVYQEHVHVPLLIHYPEGTGAQPEGSKVSSLVSSVDLLPTILSLARTPVPTGQQGRSLLTATDDMRTVFAESFATKTMLDRLPGFRPTQRAAFAGTQKLVSSASGQEFYDLLGDPMESRNLYSSGDAGPKLQAALDRWLRLAAPQNTPREVDAGAVDRLRSLGYVQ